jgi:hypothetical protein
MPPKKKRDLPGLDKPLRNKRELKETARGLNNDDEEDSDPLELREARKYIIARAKELEAHGDLPMGWEEDGTLNSGWDTNRKSGEPKFKPLREGD